MKYLITLLAVAALVPNLVMGQAAPAPPEQAKPPILGQPGYIGPGMPEPMPMGEQLASSGRFMPRVLAVEAANAALDACRARGARVAVVVLDTDGVERVRIIDDGAKLILPEAAHKKGEMSAHSLRPTEETAHNPNYQQVVRDVLGDDVTNVSGAQLIIANNEVIGVIAVGGRGAAEENWCALQGIQKIQSRLK